jgi:hypothetical protein
MTNRFFSSNKEYVCQDAHLLEGLQQLRSELREKGDRISDSEGHYRVASGDLLSMYEEGVLVIDNFLSRLIERARPDRDKMVGV